ncbi:MAG: DNA translocase FtsK 4TM domain-containing protein, partial [Muribaculaceae bacterium]|nr:DNA translocase FtsK 4TM domain-containing protein [Muribaculaceae bacterium]
MSKDNQMFDNIGVDTSAIKNRAKKREEKKRREEEEQLSAWKRFLNFFKNGRTRLALGVVLMIVGVYLLITFLSFVMFAGGNDQGKVSTKTIVDNADPAAVSAHVDNLGGSIGAATAQFFIAHGVGLAAFIIVLWCFVMGMRIMRRRRTHFYAYTLTSLYSMLTFSMVIAACTYNFEFSF